jgi:hypothetical protein
MAESLPDATALLDLPLEMLTVVCQRLDLHDLVRLAETCKSFRHGDGGLETAKLPTKSPVATALRERASLGGERISSTRLSGCSESWIAYLARCVRCCREASPFAVHHRRSLFVDAAGRLLACGQGLPVGHGHAFVIYPDPVPVSAMAGIRMRSVATATEHSLALSWDGRIYSWGGNWCGQLGHGDTLARPSPTLVKGLKGVCSVAAARAHSLAVTQSGAVFRWGCLCPHAHPQELDDWNEEPEGWSEEEELSDLAEAVEAVELGTASGEDEDSEEWPELEYAPFSRLDQIWLRPVLAEGFGGVCVRRVVAEILAAFAIGEAGELFSWGNRIRGLHGHGERNVQSIILMVSILSTK